MRIGYSMQTTRHRILSLSTILTLILIITHTVTFGIQAKIDSLNRVLVSSQL